VTFEGDEPASLTPPSATATSAGSPSWLTTVHFAFSRFHAERAMHCRLCGSSPSYATLQAYSLASFQNATLSSLVLLLGSLVILAGEYLLHGNHQWTLLSGAALATWPIRCRCQCMPDWRADTGARCGAPATSCLLLADLAVNFARSIVSSAGPLVTERCALCYWRA